MNLHELLGIKKEIQQRIIRFFNEEEINTDNFSQIINYYTDQNKQKYWNNFKEKLYLILNIVNNLDPNKTLYEKIEHLILSIQDEIKQNLTNEEIFYFFKSNKLILLILFQNKIMIPNHLIYNTLTNKKFKEYAAYIYFYPEFAQFYEHKFLKKVKGVFFHKTNLHIEDPNYIEIFNANRKSGVNHNLICQIIRKDSIDEFIVYINKRNIPLDSKIEPSIYESNEFLMKNEETTLIQYAAFYGAIQIFQYLKINNIELIPSLWLYAIHGRNPELIHILEENNVEKPLKFIKELLKLHDFEITNYFLENQIIDFKDEDLSYSIKFCNYEYYPKNLSNSSSLYYYNKYEYTLFIELLEKFQFEFPNLNKKNRKLKKIIIPYSITSIPSNFFESGLLAEIKIPLSVKSIGKQTFQSCNFLKTVTIPSSVDFIDEGCFSMCKKLEEINFEAPSKIAIIKKNTFYCCYSLKKISIPPLCNEIECEAFSQCESLKQVFISSNVASLGEKCFWHCFNLELVSLEMPSSLSVIQNNCFSYCLSFKQLWIPYSVQKIEDYAFFGCNSLTVKIPNPLNDIGWGAFEKCKSCSRY